MGNRREGAGGWRGRGAGMRERARERGRGHGNERVRGGTGRECGQGLRRLSIRRGK